jgi:biopolymer transport protein ExbB
MNDTLTNGFSRIAGVLELGGPVVGLLLAISIISLALILLKYWQFFRAGLGRQTTLQRALSSWRTGNKDAAIGSLKESSTVTGRLTWQAMVAEHNSETVDSTSLEDSIASEASREILRFKRGFRALDSIAQIAPLLGLFGTVLGMIEAFQQLQNAGTSVDPSILAGGIWVALMTTAVGLAVAIPTSLALTHLESRVAHEVARIEYAVTTVLNPVSLPLTAGSDDLSDPDTDNAKGTATNAA